ncbi:hypothetical protein [Streptomyces sp. NBC_01363]|uniref:hypothetical protein n=1 Tax=Streptomyces sp. NBC_01363 TaxID=2903840 RepID=UPI0022534D72|nr:hypothetical protein [Streptomyces sp. NBC_01363]MCX4730702.1 hypothetical protein [Streptomyces sp. NBC_01363]
MSRTQWCCLTAVLAVVLGLFCGPATAVPGGGATATAVVAAATGADAPADAGPAVAAPADRHPAPGCRKTRKHDGEPALPGRARAAYDQAPGLAEWGLPAATGQGPVHPPMRLKLSAPAPAAPTPVELSVLRV